MILAIFNLQVTLILPIMIRVNWPFYSEEIQNIGFPIKTNLATFDLQITQILPATKFQVS